MMKRPLLFGIAAVAATCRLASRADAIPPGNYDRTCRDIREGRDSLTATCRDLNGRWTRSSVPFSTCRGRVYIQNINGQLRCQT